MNNDIPDLIAVVNGKRYSFWPKFVQQKQDWIGGTLREFDPDVDETIETKIKDITFEKNGADSAMFKIRGETFDSFADVSVLGVDVCSRLPGDIHFFTNWNQFSIEKPKKTQTEQTNEPKP